jgi:hypothetical protein
VTSHETVCLLSAGERDAHVDITVYLADCEPVGPYRVTVRSRRPRRVRFTDLTDPAPVPRETDYASVIESDVPIVVQHTRLDSRHAITDGRLFDRSSTSPSSALARHCIS